MPPKAPKLNPEMAPQSLESAPDAPVVAPVEVEPLPASTAKSIVRLSCGTIREDY